MSPHVRRIGLLAAASAAGAFSLAVLAHAAPKATTPPAATSEQRVVILRQGPDERQIHIEDTDGAFDIPDASATADFAAFNEPRMGMDPTARAGDLRDMLQLRQDQEAALQAFVASMRPPEPRVMPAIAEDDRALTTPQRLEKMRARMAERQAAFERRAAAVESFYAQLSVSQRKVFDRLPGASGMAEERVIRMVRREDGPGRFGMFPRPPMPPMPPMPPLPPEPPAAPEAPPAPPAPPTPAAG